VSYLEMFILFIAATIFHLPFLTVTFHSLLLVLNSFGFDFHIIQWYGWRWRRTYWPTTKCAISTTTDGRPSSWAAATASNVCPRCAPCSSRCWIQPSSRRLRSGAGVSSSTTTSTTTRNDAASTTTRSRSTRSWRYVHASSRSRWSTTLHGYISRKY
jgi:hypothetical protein